MSSILDFEDLCPQDIIWQALTGRNEFGAPIYGLPQTFKGRRVFKPTRVAAYERGTKGQGPEVISQSQIWVLANVIIGYEDAVYVDGDFPNRWVANFAYTLNASVTDPKLHTQIVTQSGTSGLIEPAWNNNGGQTVDGLSSPPVLWLDQGLCEVPPILSITNYPDEDGPFYTKVMLGSANG